MNDMTRAGRTAFHFGQALLRDGWANDVRVIIDQGIIATVQPNATPLPGDLRHKAALPGLPNLHSHAFQRGMAGLAEIRGPAGDSFWTWREIMYRFVDRLTPDDLGAIAAMAYVEMLESGFTRVGEFHYLHHDGDGAAFADPAEMSAAIAAAASETGIALTHLPVFYAHADFGGAAPGSGQRRFIHDPDGFAALLDRLRTTLAPMPDAVLGLAPHSLRAVTPDELGALTAMAGTGPIHIHVAEQMREVEACIAWSGTRPVQWLIDNAPVGPNWCFVHATHMTDAEATAMALSGAIAGLCPITEANLGDGIFPAAPFLAAGGRYGVGSDSNVMIDAAEELRLLEYGQRLAARGRNMLAAGAGVSTGGTLWRSALDGGARALGASASIAPGAAADLITLDMDHVSLAGRDGDAILDGLLFAAGRSGISGVWRRGLQLVDCGRHRERERIAARYRTTLATLLD